jgi:integrase
LKFPPAGHPAVTRFAQIVRNKLTKSFLDGLAPSDNRYTVWDGQLPGFGVRVSVGGRKSFILRYRPKGRAEKRYVSLGRYGVVTTEEARVKAKQLLGLVANGEDPAKEIVVHRQIPKLSMVATEFLQLHVAAKRKPKTLASYTHALQHHVLPRLGDRRADDVTRADVDKLHSALADRPFMANYVVTVLSSLYAWAERRGIVSEGRNPARRIDKFRESRRERFLSHDEFARLGAALREAQTVGIPYDVDETWPMAKHAPKPENRRVIIGPDAVAAITLLTLTGCRLREILHLRWREVDFERALMLLEDSKSGRKSVVLGAAAMAILAQLPQAGDYVFPGAAGDKPRSDLKRPWSIIRRRAGLEGVRLHDLRHSYASVGIGAGLGLPVIGKLLGHTQPSTTARYAHLADDPLRQASEKIAASIVTALG